MPVQRKKKRTNSTAKKKSTTKRRTAGSKTRRRKKKSNSKKNFIIVIAVFLMIGFVIFGYQLGQNSKKRHIDNDHIESAYTTKQLLNDLVKMQRQKSKETQPPEPKKVVHRVLPKVIKPEPIKKIEKKSKKVPSKVRLATAGEKPRLVIIIDDISRKSQLNAIKNTGVKLTPAIFPPSELSMTSHHLARASKHSMIHLPMESGSKQFNSQYKTLLTHFDKDQIEQRVKELRKLFPYTKYINNHTGSVFTSDARVMGTLYHALRKEGFIFVDSRTAATTKVKGIAKKHGDSYVSRDIFIDNEHSVDHIHSQLRKAVGIAKKKGYAIAIGHPHKITMKAIKSATEIFNDVEIVYIDELYMEI